MIDAAHHELLAKVAAMYYEGEMTQHDIAAALDLSRVKIYRLLKEARESQVVRILIDWPIKRSLELETTLVERFELERALVLQTGATDSTLLRRQIAQLAARYLEGALVDNASLSICFGSTHLRGHQRHPPRFSGECQSYAGHRQPAPRAQGIRQFGADASIGAEAGRRSAILVIAAAG